MAAAAPQNPQPSLEGPTQRPDTQTSGYRFGQLSHNQFFARHNPHPGRVRHIKGLLDLPICAVNDDGYFANHYHSLAFPPNNYVENKMKVHSQVPFTMPVSTINVARTQKYPLDTINSLQYFTGLQSRSLRETKMNMIPLDQAWRDELRMITQSIFDKDAAAAAPPALAHTPPPRSPGPPASARPMYSPATGRLIPPPSRAMSRQPSRAGRRKTPAMMHISVFPDNETRIFSMLCQILQTEDYGAVKNWLVAAPEHEKATVMSIIQSAVGNHEAYHQVQPDGQEFPPKTAQSAAEPLPPIPSGSLVGAEADADRLMVHDTLPPAGRPIFGAEGDSCLAATPDAAAAVPIPVGVCEEQRPPTSAAFRPATQASGREGPAVLRLSTPQARVTSASWNPQEATVTH